MTIQEAILKCRKTNGLGITFQDWLDKNPHAYIEILENGVFNWPYPVADSLLRDDWIVVSISVQGRS